MRTTRDDSNHSRPRRATWSNSNRAYLLEWLERLKAKLRRRRPDDERNGNAEHAEDERVEDESSVSNGTRKSDGADVPVWPLNDSYPPAALDNLRAMFDLSDFETELLLLCAGVELDSEFANLVAACQSHDLPPTPSFGLGLALLSEPHWDAFTPGGKLRSWGLIHCEVSRKLIHAPLRIDERILHYLLGVEQVDERIARLVTPAPRRDDLPEHYQESIIRLAEVWSEHGEAGRQPFVQLFAKRGDTALNMVSAAATALGLRAMSLPVWGLPAVGRELDDWLRLWQREAALSDLALVLEADEQTLQDGGIRQKLIRSVERIAGPLAVIGLRERCPTHRTRVALELSDHTASPERVSPDRTWPEARLELDSLAQRIECRAAWHDLVVPDTVRELLHELTIHARRREQVYEEWGFGDKSRRGLGVSALFAGPSGTGKTMAAEAIAGRLGLELYRVDLSATISKYIGETEKNLRRIFDAAEEGRAVLLFDEADALFGKRSEVKDSHDRYANVEVSYLLQRMEAYRGLAILTTNLKDSLDQAFQRRLRFVIDFPFPGPKQRAEIWRRVFPDSMPRESLDVERLAQLNISGGAIRNLAISAAMAAAEEGGPVGMRHLLRAARIDAWKTGRSLSMAELAGWPPDLIAAAQAIPVQGELR